jgi:hypothetical protein
MIVDGRLLFPISRRHNLDLPLDRCNSSLSIFKAIFINSADVFLSCKLEFPTPPKSRVYLAKIGLTFGSIEEKIEMKGLSELLLTGKIICQNKDGARTTPNTSVTFTEASLYDCLSGCS